MKEKLLMLWGVLLSAPPAASAQEAAAFDAARFNVSVVYMTPVSYPSRTLSYGYFLALRNDSAFVCLPYVGRVYQPVLNDEGLRFSLPAKDMEVRAGDSSTRVKFTVRKPPVTYKFTVTAYPNGQADIILIPGNAQSISYSGDWE